MSSELVDSIVKGFTEIPYSQLNELNEWNIYSKWESNEADMGWMVSAE